MWNLKKYFITHHWNRSDTSLLNQYSDRFLLNSQKDCIINSTDNQKMFIEWLTSRDSLQSLSKRKNGCVAATSWSKQEYFAVTLRKLCCRRDWSWLITFIRDGKPTKRWSKKQKRSTIIKERQGKTWESDSLLSDCWNKSYWDQMIPVNCNSQIEMAILTKISTTFLMILPSRVMRKTMMIEASPSMSSWENIWMYSMLMLVDRMMSIHVAVQFQGTNSLSGARGIMQV